MIGLLSDRDVRFLGNMRYLSLVSALRLHEEGGWSLRLALTLTGTWRNRVSK